MRHTCRGPDWPNSTTGELIARNPVLGRFMMSRPLPTQGAQALATALELGFRDITLCGIDMYASYQARYGYAIPDEVRLPPCSRKTSSQAMKTLTRSTVTLDSIDACVLQFPDARIRQIGPSRHSPNASSLRRSANATTRSPVSRRTRGRPSRSGP